MRTVETMSKVPPVRADADPGGIERALALGFRLLEAAAPFSISFAELGDIDLPPVLGSDADQASLRVAAPLYLASELEAARLLPAAEILARLFGSGGISSELGPAAAPLLAFWRSRKERLSAEERTGFFARLFGNSEGPEPAGGDGRNLAFEPLMMELTRALAALAEDNTGSSRDIRAETRLRAVAHQLAANLSQRGGGFASFAANDILSATQQALELLKQPPVQRAVGASGVWLAVRNIAERYLEEQPDITAHVTRGKSGLIVLGWLADASPQLGALNAALVPPGHPAITAAFAWLQATAAAPTIGAETPSY